MAVFAVAHLHAVMRRTPEPRNRVSPDVSAVPADAIYFVDSRSIRLAIGGMALGAGKPGALHMNGVGKPDIGRLLRVHKPRSLVSRLEVVVDQDCFCFAFSNAFGVAPGAFFCGRKTGKAAVLTQYMAFAALADTRFLSVSLVAKIERLMFLHIKRVRKAHPPGQQCDGHAKSEDESAPCQTHFSTVQSVLEKKCWNKQTRCSRDKNCDTPRTGEPPSQPGA